MPKKLLTSFSDYIITMPKKEIDSDIKAFFDGINYDSLPDFDYSRMQDTTIDHSVRLSEQRAYDKQYSKLLEPVEIAKNNLIEKYNKYINNSDIEEFWKANFMEFNEYIKKYPNLESPFYSFRIDYKDNIDIIWRDHQIEQIRAALNEQNPFKKHEYSYPFKDRIVYLFGQSYWELTKSDENASEEELTLLFLEAIDKDRTKFERLRRKFSGEASPRYSSQREPISEDVRIFVWRRDEGKCVVCGSHERLEYDHIIPVSKGGSSTSRNIQLLCELCNRRKSNNI